MGDPTSGDLTLEAIGRAPWNAVRLALPESPSPDLIRTAHWSAEYVYEAALARAEDPAKSVMSAFEPLFWPMEDGTTPAAMAALALARMVELEHIDPELTRTGPHSVEAGEAGRQPQADGPMLPADDLADRIDMLAVATGERGGVADEAYRLAQSMRADEIARTGDPAVRDALTRQSGAAGQGYAAYLATLSGVQLDAAGQHDDADNMRHEAEVRREIAAGLREPPPSDGPGRNVAGPAVATPERADFMSASSTPKDFDADRVTFRPGEQDYAALRAQTLTGLEAFEADLRKADDMVAKQAETPEVAAMVAQNRAEIGAFMGVDPSGTFIYTGQTHSPADMPTDYENGPYRPGTAPEADPAAAEIATRYNEESATRQAAELAVSRGERPSDPVQAALTGLEAFEADLRKADDYAASVAEITGREAGHVAAMGGRDL